MHSHVRNFILKVHQQAMSRTSGQKGVTDERPIRVGDVIMRRPLPIEWLFWIRHSFCLTAASNISQHIRDKYTATYLKQTEIITSGHVALVDCVWNVMAHAQKPDFVFRRNGQVHLNQQGRQFSQLLAAEVCASAVVMLGTSCSEVVWRVLATHSIRQFPLHFPSRASPCAITFQLESTAG